MKISRSLFGLLGVLLGGLLATPLRAQEPSPAQVVILALDPLASELNQQSASFVVARTGPATSALEVEYTVGGTAENGVDYVKIPETVTIPADSSFANIEIVPIDDDLLEGTESVTLTLVASTNTPPPYVPSHPLAATAEISDDEKPSVDDTNVFVNIIVTDPEAAEKSSEDDTNTASFTVTRTGPTNSPLTVFYHVEGTATNGEDYVQLPGQIVIPASLTSQTIDLIPIDDELAEGLETVAIKLTLSPVLSPAGNPLPDPYLLGTNSAARAFIRDDETNTPPKVLIVSPDDGARLEAESDVEVKIAAVDHDGWVPKVELFADEELVGTAVINFLVPPLPGEPQSFTIVWSNAPAGEFTLQAKATDDMGATSLSPEVEVHVVQVVEQPVVTLHVIDDSATEQSPLSDAVADTAEVEFRRTGDLASALEVHFAVSGTAVNGTDYGPITNLIIIPAGQSSAHLDIVALDDDLVEGTEFVHLRLEKCSPTNQALVCYLVGRSDEAMVFIHDNEAPQNLSPKVAVVYPEDGSAVKANTDVEVNILTVDPDGYVPHVELYEGTNLVGELDISFLVPPPPGQPQKVSITWSNVPPGEYVLVAKAVDNQGASTLSEAVRVRAVTIDNLPVVALRAVDGLASEPDPLSDAKPDTALFEVSRTGDLSDPLSVRYNVSGSASNKVDYQELSGEITIPAGAASATIEVIPSEDDLVERTESVVVSLVQLRCFVPLGDSPPPGCYLVGKPGTAISYIRDADSAPQEPPTVAILSPPNGAVLTAPKDVRLVAAAHDPDGWVATVEFFDGTNSLGVVSNKVWALPRTPPQMSELLGRHIHDHITKPFSMNWRNPAPGKHVITALATDFTGLSARSDAVEITVVDDSTTPVVNVMATDAVAREGTTNTATFKLRRSGSTAEPLTVYYTVGGSAQNGTDYTEIEDSFTIPAGLRNARIVIEPMGDDLAEGAETVVLELKPSPDPDATYEVGRLPAAACVILDFSQNISAKEVLPGGKLHFRLPIPVGIPYRLEASSNLRTWQAVISDVSTENGVSFIEERPASQANRFFRIVPEYGTPETE